MIAADSLSDCLTSSWPLRPGSSRATSRRMIAGIIWKVEALPTRSSREEEEEAREEDREGGGLVLHANA